MKNNELNPADGAVALVFVIGLSVIGFFIYFLPSFVAIMRGHQNWPAILVLNIFIGWTFVGYVAALVWSFTEVKNRRHQHMHYHQHTSSSHQVPRGQPPIIDPNRNPFDFD